MSAISKQTVNAKRKKLCKKKKKKAESRPVLPASSHHYGCSKSPTGRQVRRAAAALETSIANHLDSRCFRPKACGGLDGMPNHAQFCPSKPMPCTPVQTPWLRCNKYITLFPMHRKTKVAANRYALDPGSWRARPRFIKGPLSHHPPVIYPVSLSMNEVQDTAKLQAHVRRMLQSASVGITLLLVRRRARRLMDRHRAGARRGTSGCRTALPSDGGL